MAITVKTTSLADAKIQNLSPTDFVAFDQLMGVASGVNLPGRQNGLRSNEPDRIAVINHIYDIYLLDPGSPCAHPLCAYDGGPYIIVADLKDRNSIGQMDTHFKRSLATACAWAIGVNLYDIVVV